MINKSILLVVLAFHATCAFALDPVMENCGRPMEIFESSLRVLLNRPAKGFTPLAWRKEKSKVEAALRLAAWDGQYPGCLQGAYGESDWNQYKAVRQLYKEFSDVYQYIPANSNSPQLMKCKVQLQSVRNGLDDRASVSVTEKLKKQLDEALSSLDHPVPENTVAPAQ